MDLSPELIDWTRDALERLFDLAFLRHHIHAMSVAGRFTDSHALQQSCLDIIRQFKPPLNVPAIAPGWRIYNVLNLRYVQGLSQSETAAQLGISTRQMRREQQRAVHAVAAVLFDEVTDEQVIAADIPTQPPASEIPALWEQSEDPTQRFSHLDDLLRSTLHLFDPLVEQQRLRVRITMPPSMPPIRADQMVLRQMLVSGISWLVRDSLDATLTVEALIERGKIILNLGKPHAQTHAALAAAQDEIAAAQQLASIIGAGVNQSDSADMPRLQYILPTNDAKCVLMIDDQVHAILLARRYFQQSDDFYLESISAPHDIVHQVTAIHPACILLDVMMPERDGWEVLTLLRAHPETRAIPIVISSVLKETELAYSLGATAILAKPFSAAELINLLKSVTQEPAKGPRGL